VRYNERIRVAGHLISDESLADLLERVLDATEDLGPSFFEVTTVATFLAFAETPADACVIETGLGGRLDATNVLENPAVCGIATLGIDHEAFLLVPEAGTPEEPLARIAFEKASIAKPGAPLVVQNYAESPLASVLATAGQIGAPVLLRGRDWWADVGEAIHYRDAQGALELPLPALAGAHQADNAALAVAMLRHQSVVPVSAGAIAQGIRAARWPARLQRLGAGPLTALTGNRTIWLDGGHNPDAGEAIARHFSESPPLHLVMGMLTSKDPSAILRPLSGRLASVSIVPAPGHEAHTPADFAPFTALPVRNFTNVAEALAALPPEGDVLIAGSLYLAGDVLRRNGEAPD
jgi:dihydrofolate synthase/folylpolyglutamate synthase